MLTNRLYGDWKGGRAEAVSQPQTAVAHEAIQSDVRL